MKILLSGTISDFNDEVNDIVATLNIQNTSNQLLSLDIQRGLKMFLECTAIVPETDPFLSPDFGAALKSTMNPAILEYIKKETMSKVDALFLLVGFGRPKPEYAVPKNFIRYEKKLILRNYNWAKEYKIPIFPFLCEDETVRNYPYVDDETNEIEEFRQKLESECKCYYFDSKSDLIKKMIDCSFSLMYKSFDLPQSDHKKWIKSLISDLKINEIVFETLFSIAIDIANEGREGRSIGTAFLIGDEKNVLKNSKQLGINPFKGQKRCNRMIINPSVKSIVKEYAQLDGAFILDSNGYIFAAGRYLIPDVTMTTTEGGARHSSVKGITQICNCIGVVVSQSGGVISIYKKGELIKKFSKI